MAELPQNTTIQNASLALSDQVNFQYLKQIGLDAIIRSASEKWTDYNEHDPGITILEVLVYALTDLGYRTDFSIEDIIAQEQLSIDALAKDQFYTASEILTVNPVSLNDYRRIIIDLEEVDNAWVLPLADPLNPFQGLLQIWVNPKIGKKTDLVALDQKIRKKFFKHRSLSQDLSCIVFRKALELSFKMELVLDPKKVKNVEQELAQVLLEIKEFISEKIYFLSLNQMMIETNGKVNAIFNGPELKHGFLPDASLKPMVTELMVIHLLPIIQKTEGVVMVGDLEFRTNPKSSEWLKKIDIPTAERMILGAVAQQEITVLLGDTPYLVNKDQLQFEFDKLLHQQANSKLVSADRDLPISVGDYRDMESYFSIQNEFPTIYGLEPFGPPPDASRDRLAQIQQLKSYLLIFDQIMSNYLAQLAHLTKLYSWNKDIQRTYFFQGLSDAVGSLEELLVDPKFPADASKDAKDIMANYLKKLSQFTEDETTFLDRRNRFLDHLLARFGRQLIIGNHKLKDKLKAVQKKQELHEIDTKLRILENYPRLSSERGKAFNMETEDFTKEFSGLRNWVETLFFMDPENIEKFRFNQRFKQAVYIENEIHQKKLYKESGFSFTKTDGSTASFEEVMQLGKQAKNYNIIGDDKSKYSFELFDASSAAKSKKPTVVYTLKERFATEALAKSATEDLFAIANYKQSGFIFITECGSAVDLKEIMRIGTNPDNYYLDNRVDKPYRVLLFKQTDLLKAAKVYELDKKYKTAKEAFAAIDDVVALLRRYDRSSESVYILEHLLMRPMPNEQYFGLELLDENQETFLTTKKWYAQSILDLIKEPLRKDQFYYCIKGETACSKMFKKKGRKQTWKQYAKFNFKLIEKTNAFGETNYQVNMRYDTFDRYVKFKGVKLYATKKEAIEAIDKWMKRLETYLKSSNSKDVLFKPFLSPWPKPSDQKPKKKKASKVPVMDLFTLNADLFSNMLTVVLPKWPSRFQNKGFKNQLEQTLQEEAPAHLWLNILWLEKVEFQRFQELFGEWWNAYKAEALDAYLYRENIVDFIIEKTYDQLEILNTKKVKIPLKLNT